MKERPFMTVLSNEKYKSKKYARTTTLNIDSHHIPLLRSHCANTGNNNRHITCRVVGDCNGISA